MIPTQTFDPIRLAIGVLHAYRKAHQGLNPRELRCGPRALAFLKMRGYPDFLASPDGKDTFHGIPVVMDRSVPWYEACDGETKGEINDAPGQQTA